MTTLKTIEQLKSEINALENVIGQKENEIARFEYVCSEAEFDGYLDDGGEERTSVGTFYPSDILKSCDPVAYRCAKSDYEANFDLEDCEAYQDLLSELDELENSLSDLDAELEELENAE